MSKSSRCTTDEVYAVGFVPTYLLPNKTTISLDPFLEPLIRDIENGFINGMVYAHISFEMPFVPFKSVLVPQNMYFGKAPQEYCNA